MSLSNQIPDKTLLKSVIQRMTRKGISPGRFTTTVRSGNVTISGTIDYEHERRSILGSVNNIPGVTRIVDQIRVEKKKRS
jgi:osmotically-inducible protein OsmY